MTRKEKLLPVIFHLGEHFVLALILFFLLGWLTGSLYLGMTGALASIFIDLDHLLEYLWFLKRPLSWVDFLSGSHFAERGKSYLIFHGWEYLVILFLIWLVTKNSFFLAVGLGMGIHLILDHFYFAAKRASYSILYRALMGFKMNKLFK